MIPYDDNWLGTLDVFPFEGNRPKPSVIRTLRDVVANAYREYMQARALVKRREKRVALLEQQLDAAIARTDL